MNSGFKFVLGLLIAGIAAALAFTYNVSKRAAKIGYVNSARLVSEYNGTKTVQAEFKAKTAVLQANLDTLENELKTAGQKYEADKARLKPKEQEYRLQQLRDKEMQLAQYREAIQQKVRQEDQRLKEQVFSEIDTYIKKFGADKGYTFILGATDAGNVIYAEKGTDLTEEILTGLNTGQGSRKNE